MFQTSLEGDKKIPIFVLVIHLSGSGGSQNLQSSTEGWVVTRKLQDFQAVHEKLIQVYKKTFLCLFVLALYVLSTIFQLYRDGSSWVEPVLSYLMYLAQGHNAVTPERLKPMALQSRV